MNITTLQAKMLKKIATDEFTPVNGSEPQSVEDTHTFADGVIETAQDKGTFTSLLNAGLVGHHEAGAESTVWLTSGGLKAYKAI